MFNRYRTAATVALAPVALCAFTPWFGVFSTPTAAESLTLSIGRQYSAIAFLVTLTENLSPLYYLLAHFFLFLPGGFFLLRLASAACLGLSVASAIRIALRMPSEREKDAGHILLFFSSLLPLAFAFAWRAVPFFPALSLLILSIELLSLSGNDNLRSRRLYPAVASASCFMSFQGLIVFLLLSGRARRAYIPMRWAWTAFAVASALRLLAFFKRFSIDALNATTNTFPAILFHDGFSKALATLLTFNTGLIISILFLMVFLTLFVSGSSRFWRSAACVGAIGVLLFGLASLRPVLRESSAWQSVKNSLRSVGDHDAVVFLNDNSSRDQYYLYLHTIHSLHRDGTVYPSRLYTANDPRLGFSPSAFPGVDNFSHANALSKELFLRNDSVWIVKKINSGFSGTEDDSFLNWLSCRTRKVVNRRFDTYTVQKIWLRPGISRDAIALDILLNDRHRPDLAIQLLKSLNYDATALEGYFCEENRSSVERKSKTLLSACGSDIRCLARVHSMLANHDGTTPVGGEQ